MAQRNWLFTISLLTTCLLGCEKRPAEDVCARSLDSASTVFTQRLDSLNGSIIALTHERDSLASELVILNDSIEKLVEKSKHPRVVTRSMKGDPIRDEDLKPKPKGGK